MLRCAVLHSRKDKQKTHSLQKFITQDCESYVRAYRGRGGGWVGGEWSKEGRWLTGFHVPRHQGRKWRNIRTSLRKNEEKSRCGYFSINCALYGYLELKIRSCFIWGFITLYNTLIGSESFECHLRHPLVYDFQRFCIEFLNQNIY